MLIISAIINIVMPNGIDDISIVNPNILIADLSTLTKKCGVNFSFIL